VESLIEHPAIMTHARSRGRANLGIDEACASVGIERSTLIAELKHALE
jgi:cystathionine beta-lyase/cystathionine gamma-synthase